MSTPLINKQRLRFVYSLLGIWSFLMPFASSFALPSQKLPEDPIIAQLIDQYPNKSPEHPQANTYGMDANGTFKHPLITPKYEQAKPFEGQLDYWDTQSYQHNMSLINYYPITVEPFHTWQNILSFGNKKYLYQYVRRDMKIFDITDPYQVELLYTQGSTWGPSGPSDEVNPLPPGDMTGAASIAWNTTLKRYVMIQSHEIQRFGVLKDKYSQTNNIDKIRKADHLKGFKVYVMEGPLPKDWRLVATRTTDITHPQAPIGSQQGSGARDRPTYFGGQFMFLAAASTATQALTEYPNDLYSAGYQAWDLSDISTPRFLGEILVPGQRIDNAFDRWWYKQNPRAGNRTSWMGARMSLFIPTPVEQGGRYAYAAMGGLGFFIIDVSKPNNMKVVSQLSFPPSVAGTEGDFIDISQVNSTGILYLSGYPLNEDCYEPYKHIYPIDVKNPAKPKILAPLPRPKPPSAAPFTDFCQRKGSFGPKRSGGYTQPGFGKEGLLIYNFYNAGVQIFDVSDTEHPKIAGYFVPPNKPEAVHPSGLGNLSHAVYTEYDRKIVWLFTNHGFYALKTPLLGEPNL